MNIELEGWIIKKSEGINVFDIYQKKKRKEGNNIGMEVESAFAFGIGFARCMQIIIQENMDEENDVVTIEKYLKEYKKISESFLEKLEKLLA